VWSESTHAVDRELVAPFRAIVQPFWAPNNRIIWDGYQSDDVAFPFERLSVPSFALEVGWTISQLVDYMMTWSAFKRSRDDANARKSMDDLLLRARSIFPLDEVIQFRMPLKVVAGRVV
jgi:hypothetical protein